MLNKKDDLLVIIDMINGFSYEGNFASPNVVAMIEPLASFVKKHLENHVEIIHYTDWHPSDAQEFATYPIHCLQNTSEAQVVSALDFKEIEVIHKNSTNGFHAKNPFDYHKNIYIVGCVTDICVFEFALTAQKYKEEFSLPYSVNVISDLVTTFDAPEHNAKEVSQKVFRDVKKPGY